MPLSLMAGWKEHYNMHLKLCAMVIITETNFNCVEHWADLLNLNVYSVLSNAIHTQISWLTVRMSML